MTGTFVPLNLHLAPPLLVFSPAPSASRWLWPCGGRVRKEGPDAICSVAAALESNQPIMLQQLQMNHWSFHSDCTTKGWVEKQEEEQEEERAVVDTSLWLIWVTGATQSWCRS